MDLNVKKAAKKGAELWAAKKGLQMTGSLLKLGAIAGAGYLAFKFFKRNEVEIKEKLSME